MSVAEAAALAPEGLLQTPHGVSVWKAIIWQLEDQHTDGAAEPEVIATQAMGLSEFALRFQQTPYATLPMRPCRRARSKEKDESTSVENGGTHAILQCLEDSMVSLQGAIWVLVLAARYITLHGGVGELGAEVIGLQHELLGVAQGVTKGFLKSEQEAL